MKIIYSQKLIIVRIYYFAKSTLNEKVKINGFKPFIKGDFIKNHPFLFSISNYFSKNLFL